MSVLGDDSYETYASSHKEILCYYSPIAVLQELALRRGYHPVYTLTAAETGTHITMFKYEVRVGHITAFGSGPSKKEARCIAASNALKYVLCGSNVKEALSKKFKQLCSIAPTEGSTFDVNNFFHPFLEKYKNASKHYDFHQLFKGRKWDDLKYVVYKVLRFDVSYKKYCRASGDTLIVILLSNNGSGNWIVPASGADEIIAMNLGVEKVFFILKAVISANSCFCVKQSSSCLLKCA